MKIPINKVEEKAEELHLQVLERFSRNGRTMVKVRCKDHPEKGERLIDQYNLLHKLTTCGCKRQRLSLEEFLKETSLEPEVEIVGEYINNGTKIRCRCRVCAQEWETTPNKLQQGTGCPYCWPTKIRNLFRKSQEQFERELQEVNPLLKVLSPYQNSRSKIRYQCLLCGQISESTPTKLLVGESSCHYCKTSLGERKIIDILEKVGIQYEREKKFQGCQDKRPLPFDFYLPDYRALIEFQGEQHFSPVDFSYSPTEESRLKALNDYEKLTKRDDIKKQFALDNIFIFIEITYKDKNKIGKIIKDKLNL